MLFTTESELLPESGTWFAPPERVVRERLIDLAEFCLHNPITQVVLESIDGFVLILNEQRQVLAANPETLAALKVRDTDCLLGVRPGEAFGCKFSALTPNGCGTSKFCTTCGAVISIVASQFTNLPSQNECLMTVERNGLLEAHEFHVKASPLDIEGHRLTVFVIHDISAGKRRDFLENIFIHDIKNILTGLQGWSEVLVRRPRDAATIAEKIVSISSHLTTEVNNQSILLQAERGELQVALEPVEPTSILNDVALSFSSHPLNAARLLFVPPVESDCIATCPPLLTRVLINMVKNALEATDPPDKVTIRFESHAGQPRFLVSNPGVIPEDIALQIFKRSFSTKQSAGRGLGTYSMKLFGEQYLKGHVDFISNEHDGTIFYITLPAAPTG